MTQKKIRPGKKLVQRSQENSKTPLDISRTPVTFLLKNKKVMVGVKEKEMTNEILISAGAGDTSSK